MNIFEELRKDHETQRSLIHKLTDTSGPSDDRKRLFYQMKHELEQHASAEEKYFYSRLMKKEQSQEKARHSVAEHKELDDYIETLEATDMSSSKWLDTAKTLKDRLLHHLKEEEREMFQVAGKALSDDQKQNLGADYREEMKEAS